MPSACTCVSLGVGLFCFSAWLGFVLNVQHGPPAPRGPAPQHGPQKRAPSKRKRADDDLDMAAHARHHIHAEDSDHIKLQWNDWSAGGKFSKPAPRPYDGGAYPPFENLWEIVERWNPDNVTLPHHFRETLQVFNYSNPSERYMAETYRNAELPFKIYGVPDIEAARDEWTDGFLVDNFDKGHRAQFKVELSKNNHFMYWRSPSASGRREYPDWTSPTEVIQSTFADWLDLAHAADAEKLHHGEEHRYLMMGTPPLYSLIQGKKVRRTHFVTKSLPCFTPREENFFVTDVPHNKGIQCRFGMRGVIAEAHYDGGRNMVAMLKGAKRYILAPPRACHTLSLIKDRKHPSFRHSTTDWSHPEQAKDAFSGPEALAIDTVVREGEILYIPSYWIHYIISLKYSIQCNTRSGSPPKRQGEEHIARCMGDQFSRAPGMRERPVEKKKKKKLRGAEGFPIQSGEIKDH